VANRISTKFYDRSSGSRKHRYHEYENTPLSQEWLEIFKPNSVRTK